MSTETINAQIQTLAPGALVSLYVLDATLIGGDLLRFYPGTSALQVPIVWQGQTYTPWTLELRGMVFTGQSAPPRPEMSVGNQGGTFTALCLAYDDLIGAKLSRKRTFAKFLDGLPAADPTQSLPDDVFFIDRKVTENKYQVVFELAAQMVIDDLALPRRRVHANLCQSHYRGTECGYTGTAVGDDQGNSFGAANDLGEWDVAEQYVVNDAVFLTLPSGQIAYFYCYFDDGEQVVGEEMKPPNATYWKRDMCPKNVIGCKLRFNNPPTGLPFGGFPGTRRMG